MNLIEAPLSNHRNALTTGWTVERIELLKDLWSTKGYTASDIALELGGFDHCSDGGRSAVIGKVHRLNLAVRASDIHKQLGTEHRESRPKTRHIACHLIKSAKDATEKPIEEAAPEVALDIPPHQRVPLLALTATSCRFPVGEPQNSDFGFCPSMHVKGSSYCAGHHRLAYAPRAPGRPRGERKQNGWG